MFEKRVKVFVSGSALCALLTLSAFGMGNRSICEERAFNITFLTPAATRIRTEAQIRQLLWNHFNQHRRTCLRVKWFTKEGDPNTYDYRIEPINGEWIIGIDVKREMYQKGSPSAAKKRVVRENYLAKGIRVVPLIQSPSNPAPPSTPDIGYFEEHKVQLLDSAGGVIQEI